MTIKELCDNSFAVAEANGFWDTDRNIPEMLMLIVSELSEGLEALRKGKNSIPDNPTIEDIKGSFQEEVADTFIRLGDLCKGLGIDIEKVIEIKMEYNKSRGYKHGKSF